MGNLTKKDFKSTDINPVAEANGIKKIVTEKITKERVQVSFALCKRNKTVAYAKYVSQTFCFIHLHEKIRR